MTRVLTQRELNRSLLARQPTDAEREQLDEAAALVRFMEPAKASYSVTKEAVS